MTLTQYIEGLRLMDWEYDFSDDYRVYRKWKDMLDTLKMARPAYDENGDIWNQYAPQNQQYKRPLLFSPELHAADLAISKESRNEA